MFYCFPNEIQLPGTQSFSIFGSGGVGYLKKSSGRVGYRDPVRPWSCESLPQEHLSWPVCMQECKYYDTLHKTWKLKMTSVPWTSTWSDDLWQFFQRQRRSAFDKQMTSVPRGKRRYRSCASGTCVLKVHCIHTNDLAHGALQLRPCAQSWE